MADTRIEEDEEEEQIEALTPEDYNDSKTTENDITDYEVKYEVNDEVEKFIQEVDQEIGNPQRIAIDHINPDLYEEDSNGLHYDDAHNDPHSKSPVPKQETGAPAIFAHYGEKQDDDYDSHKVAVYGDDHYIETNEESDTYENYQDFSGDKEGEDIIETIIGHEIESGIFDQHLDDDVDSEEQERLQAEKYEETKRADEKVTKSNYKGWLVFMSLVGIFFFATTRRKVRRLMPGNLRRNRSAGLITVDKHGCRTYQSTPIEEQS